MSVGGVQPCPQVTAPSAAAVVEVEPPLAVVVVVASFEPVPGPESAHPAASTTMHTRPTSVRRIDDPLSERR